MSQQKKPSLFVKKTLLLVNTVQQFKNIINDTEQSQLSENELKQQTIDKEIVTPLQQSQQEEIVVPRYGKVMQEKQQNHKKSLKTIFTHGYFRLRQLFKRPSPQVYEPTSSDLHFIKSLKSTFTFNSKYTFSPKTFCDMIQSCQHNFHKLKTITMDTPPTDILGHLSFNLPLKLTTCFEIHEKKLLSKLFLKVIEYWKNVKIRRQGFPLLRCYWPKSDIAMTKFGYWMPFKTRVIEENSKTKPSNPYLQKLGHTQKQQKINKEAKQASGFYDEVKKIAQEHSREYSRFKKQTIRFHNYASMYGLQSPKYLVKVIDCVQKLKYKDQLKKIRKSPYFQYPVVKLRQKTSGRKNYKLQKTFEASYDPMLKQVNLIQASRRQVKLEVKSQHLINPKKRTKDFEFSNYQENQSKKKMKVE